MTNWVLSPGKFLAPDDVLDEDIEKALANLDLEPDSEASLSCNP